MQSPREVITSCKKNEIKKKKKKREKYTYIMSYGSNDSSLFLFLIFLLFNDYKVFNGGFLSLIYIYIHTHML